MFEASQIRTKTNYRLPKVVKLLENNLKNLLDVRGLDLVFGCTLYIVKFKMELSSETVNDVKGLIRNFYTTFLQMIEGSD